MHIAKRRFARFRGPKVREFGTWLATFTVYQRSSICASIELLSNFFLTPSSPPPLLPSSLFFLLLFISLFPSFFFKFANYHENVHTNMVMWESWFDLARFVGKILSLLLEARNADVRDIIFFSFSLSLLFLLLLPPPALLLPLLLAVYK